MSHLKSRSGPLFQKMVLSYMEITGPRTGEEGEKGGRTPSSSAFRPPSSGFHYLPHLGFNDFP